MRTTRMMPQNCPKCGGRFTGAVYAESDDILPRPGDLTLCIECVTVLVFEPGMTVREFTREEMDSLSLLELAELYGKQKALHQMHEQRRQANAKNN
jgi:hypothetical protein